MWTGLLVLPLLHTGYPRLQAGSGFLPASHAQGSLTSASVGCFCHRVDSSLIIHNRIKRGMKILLQLPSLLFSYRPRFLAWSLSRHRIGFRRAGLWDLLEASLWGVGSEWMDGPQRPSVPGVSPPQLLAQVVSHPCACLPSLRTLGPVWMTVNYA